MNVEAKKLNHKRGILLEELNNLKHEAEMISARISDQKKQLDGKKYEIIAKEAAIKNLGIQILLAEDFPRKVIYTRNEILLAKKEMKSKEITIRQQEELEKKVNEFTEELKKFCDHRLLVGIFGYHLNNDDESSCLGERECAICGLRDTEIDCEKGNYKTLNLDGNRIHLCPPFRGVGFNSMCGEFEEKCVGEIRDYFKERFEKERWRID